MRIQLTIFKKGLILVSLPLLSQLAFLGLFAEMQRSNAEVQGWFAHSKDVIVQTQVVRGTLMEVESSFRSLSGGEFPASAETFERAMRRLPDELASLKSIVGDNAEQEARAAALGEKASQLMACLAESKRLAGEGAQSQTALREKGRISQARMDDLRHQLAIFLQEEERLDGVRRQNLESSQRQLQQLLFGGAIVAILSTGLLAFAFSRGISRRLAVLTKNAQRLGAGKELLRPVAGSDEIARVDRSFHLMAQELATSGKALRAQTQILQSVLDNMADGVVVADEKGKFLFFNPAAKQILGVGLTDTRPDAWADCYGVHLPDKQTPCPTEQLPLVQAIRGKTVDGAELWVSHPNVPDGVWISQNARPLRGADGTVQGGVVVFHDVSQRKRAEEMMQRLNEELERRVAERTRELKEANRNLVQKNQENELFVYSVSHDLRSPLVNLEGFSEELSMVSQDLRELLADDNLPPSVRERGMGLLDGDMTESIRFIRSGVRRLSNIIDGLLQLSRAGRVVFQCQRVEVNAVVARVVESLHGTIAERKAIVTVAELPPVWGDAAAVEQIFANLIGNALNYLDPLRSGVIEIDSPDIPGEEGANGQPALRTFSVKDNGLGIPAAYQAKVFQAFQRLHPGATKGEGIGLSLVRRVVERLGGRIWFQSTEGVGSTFFVNLAGLPAHESPQSFRSNRAGTTEQEQVHDSAAVLDPVG